MRSNSDHKTQQLVALAQDGDPSALNQLCGVYTERVRWMIRLRLGKELRPKLESIDLAQDALMHALRGLDRFTYKDEGDFVRWLAKIAENTLRDNLDKQYAHKRDIRKEVRVDHVGPVTGGRPENRLIPIQATTPSVIASNREDIERLDLALDTLAPEYRDVIVQTKLEGLSYREIAEKLGKSPDAVRMLVARAMAALTTAFRRL